uniref:Transposase-like protein n=1 Tax=Moniliophthora roreri TaxID=221103 RepID=A0A0W0GFI2_MONRR
MKLGEKMFDETREMFKDLDLKISLSIDAWTLSNSHAFLAIVAHWVSNEGHLELLIDFCPLMGEHSGENMAAVVWETMEKYGITGKIMAIMMDNASNNDTLMEELELHCFSTGIQFSVKDARMHCMPHIIHLAALKLLEVPVDCNFDDHAVLVDIDDEEDTFDSLENALGTILCKIVHAVHQSPQCQEAWIKEVKNTLGNEQDNDSPALMLILDVKTHWSSTHQMLHKSSFVSILWHC